MLDDVCGALCGLLCQVVFLGGLLYIVVKVIEHCYFRKLLLEGLPSRHVFITGCDMGFGQRLAKRLDGQGVNVYAACLTQQGVEDLQQACSSRLTAMVMDVRKTEDIKKAVDLVTSKVPAEKGLWGVVNNAGVMNLPGPASWYSRDDFRQMMEINALGMIDVSIQFLPLIKKSRGRIVITSSILGEAGVCSQAPYCASKFAIAGFTDSFRRELKCWGVSVIGLRPGAHNTNLLNQDALRNNVHRAWDRLPEDMKQQYGDNYRDCLITEGIRAMNLTGSSNLDTVVDTYYLALFARYPKAIYRPGWDVYMYQSLEYVPSWMTDRFTILLGMKPAQLP